MTTIDQQVIGFSDSDDYLVLGTTRAQQPVRQAVPSQFAAFLEDELQFRTATVAPDMSIMKARATVWLRRQEPDIPEQWLEAKACSLVSFTRMFFAGYQGFRNAPASL